ncbi:hybrid sensor histidine kinase/response regulator transcription factor [Spirosoma agri]|uniref:histidine kinase n=1 Tax=Spirosoma agri TaxID=1987381 RepID=A0A6M0ISZ0_9BACT|nr:hybrid sensor histidine kinase/response regulator transcription factor [Spirosoma agri]NEU70805.1 response regulator [Spirosoma agri]
MGQRTSRSGLMTLALYLGWLTALLATQSLGAQSLSLPKPELITARQGLPQAFVPAILQDKRGFIWMATRDGLCRYDGYSFRVFQPAADGRPSLSSPGLTNLTSAPDGYIWIQNDQFGLDGFDPVRETFTNLSRQPAYRQVFGQDTLLTIYPDTHRRLWLIFRRGGLARYDRDTHRFVRYPHRAGQSTSPSSNTITSVLEDSRGQLWLATPHGLDRFEPSTDGFSHVAYPTAIKTPVQQLYRRANGELWLCSDRQLARWNPATGETHVYPLAWVNQLASWTHQLTTDSQGTEYINLGRQLFRYTDAQGLQPLHIPDGATQYVSLFIDRSDVLWLGTDLAGVHKINLRAPAFQNRPYQRSFVQDWLTDYAHLPASRLPTGLAHTSPYNFRVTTDAEGQLWFAVGGTPLYRLNPATHQLTTVAGPATLRDYRLERPTLLATDPAGMVWVVHPDWTGYYDTRQNRWVRFAHPFQTSIRSAMLQAVVDRRAVWIATASTGLYRVDRRSGQVRHYQRQSRDSTSLSSDNLYWLNADPLDTNRLWIGTFGGGLCQFDKRTGRSVRFTTRQGLPNNVVYAAVPDRWGSVWLATNQGLGQLNRATGRIRVYRQEDGLGADEFNRFHAVSMPGIALRDSNVVGPTPGSAAVRGPAFRGPAFRRNGISDERIVLGNISGLVGFDPRTIRPDTFQPEVQLSDILVNNRSLLDSLPAAIPFDSLHQLTLPHDQNFITIRFAAMQYNRLGQAVYRYRLAGLSPGWVVTQRPEAIFTALAPGCYRLTIQAANTAGQWSRHVRSLSITIDPPWWRSGWAYLVYALVGIGLLAGFSRYRSRQQQAQQDQRDRQREAEQLRVVDELKTRFFANITHEFRTPLTLILSPLETLIADLRQTRYGERLSLVERNARQLLGLINQLMELARLDARMMQVTPVRGRPDEVVAGLVQTFAQVAEARSVQLIYRPQEMGLFWFDADKLERIVINLLANALKFTPSGSVTVTLSPITTGTDSPVPGLQLSVADTGIGIAADQLPHLFKRFYQVGSPDDGGALGCAQPRARDYQPGSGIGLALVKELIDVQGGQIRVDSQPGRGTTVYVELPYPPVTDSLPEPLLTPQATPPVGESGGFTPQETEPAMILLVEDNDDLAQFIGQSLPPHYQLHRANDGLDGLEQARRLMPDLIISDVMMPRLDGYALCQRLKSDMTTDHIPLLLLTAKVSLESRMQGLAMGADEYLAKPFHLPELLLRINNLLATRRRLRERLQHQLTAPVPDPAALVHLPFVETLQRLLDQHLAEAGFGVDQLAAGADLSRMQLHRKLKSLTGLTTTEFMRTYRLQQALPLLARGLSVSQAAYAVGFENPSYFGQCFRELFGYPPSDYGTTLTERA